MFVEKGCFVNIHASLDQETGRAGEGMADDDTWSGGGTWSLVRGRHHNNSI